MGKKLDCDTPEYHKLHSCKLSKYKADEELEKRSQQAKVKCKKCGMNGIDKKDVCKPEKV